MKNAVSHVATGLLLTLVSLFVLALVPVSEAQIACDPGSSVAGSATPPATPAAAR